jgi:uncharacterized surface protein with fasciclin (FAS1) repeats
MKANPRRSIGILLTSATLLFGLAACGGDSDDMSGPEQAKPDSSASAMETTDAGAQTFGPGCPAIPKSGPGSFYGMVKDPVATAASNNPLLSTLVTAVTKADLVDTLNQADGLTVFAPTNEAFAKIPAADLAAVLADKEKLTAILTHHVVSGQLDPEEVVGDHDTLNKDAVTVTGDDKDMKVDGASVICGNIPTANATVYVIDTVLMPGM